MTDDEESSGCVIEGDVTVTVNGSIVETTTMTIVGIINVTGNVVVADRVIVKLSTNATLHVAKCLVLDDKAGMVVEVADSVNGENGNDRILATYDSSCSTQQLAERVSIETTSSFDECRDGRPIVEEYKEINGRARLQLVFVHVDECTSGESEVNLVVIAIVVPIAVVILVVTVVLAVPQFRAKVLPTRHYIHSLKQQSTM